MVEDRLSEFATLLRQNGLKVSPAELADAGAALGLLGLGDRSTAHAALRSTLVKRGRDAPVFDRLFSLYFGGLGQLLDGLEKSLLKQLADEGLFSQDALEMIAYEVAHRPLSALARAALEGDVAALSRLLRGAALQVDLAGIQNQFQAGFYARRLGAAAGMGGLAGELKALEDDLRSRGLDPAGLELVSRRLAQALRKLEGAIQKLVKLELEGREVAKNRRSQFLGERSFAQLTPEEIGRMETAVRRLAERLKTRIARRQRSRRRGALSVRRTLRRNLSQGGIPMRPVFRQKKALRPDVMVLCDVSDSVRNVSRFMLQFVYSLQDLYSRVRSFIFVSELGEVTRLFEEQEISEAIEESLSGGIINVFAHSDFGRAFRSFQRDHIAAVNNKTSVIVLGDARNNYNLPHEWVLKEIHQRAKQVIWLNPENRLTWGFGDSEMDRYLPYCDVVEECRNLNQLYRVIDRLVS